MVAGDYIPDRGDIVWLEFTPQAGREQAGRRPALVLSPRNYNDRSSLALLCPITSRVRGYPFEVQLPPSGPVTGVVLADQLRSQDWRARHAKFAARASPQTLSETQEKIGVLMFPNLPESTQSIRRADLIKAADAFAGMFELVFDYDWPTTQANLANPAGLIDERGTFIQPLVEDESNDWANRGALLGAYRELLRCMEDCGIQREELWGTRT